MAERSQHVKKVEDRKYREIQEADLIPYVEWQTKEGIFWRGVGSVCPYSNK